MDKIFKYRKDRKAEKNDDLDDEKKENVVEKRNGVIHNEHAQQNGVENQKKMRIKRTSDDELDDATNDENRIRNQARGKRKSVEMGKAKMNNARKKIDKSMIEAARKRRG